MLIPSLDLFQWQELFGTEELCLEAVAQIRWGSGFICPKCGHGHAWICHRRHRRRCTRCKKDTSPTAGTMLAYSHTPLKKWFLAIYLLTVTSHIPSANHMAKVLGLSSRTFKRIAEKLLVAESSDNRLVNHTSYLEAVCALTNATSIREVSKQLELFVGDR